MIIRKNQKKHDYMIAHIAKALQKAGYINIKANLPSYTKPEKVLLKNIDTVHVPDITALKHNTNHIIEIETEDTLTDEHTAEQWILLSRFAAETKALFYVFVPAGCKRTATHRISTLGISGNTNIIEFSTS